MLRVLDLFSGIGGMSLGLEATGGFETVGFCEIEPYPRAVLAKHWPGIPIYDDVRTLNHDGPVDVICGGYPCQPFSLAGERRGAEDDRHLWPAMFSLIKKHRPAWVLGENVAGHINMGLDEVLSDLEGEGYAARAFVIPACAVDAPHRRDRVWIVGHAPKLQRNVSAEHPKQSGRQVSKSGKPSGAEDVADAERCGQSGQREFEQPRNQTPIGERGKWSPEPDVGRVAHGVPNRIHRLKALGNAVVPQAVEMIGYAILAAHYGEENETSE